MKEGNEIQFISSVNGYGVTERYSLTEINGVTTLIVKIDVPQEQEETFNIRFPKARELIIKYFYLLSRVLVVKIDKISYGNISTQWLM